jgi:hypothetical protein
MSSFSPPTDRKRAAEILTAVLDGDVAAGVAMPSAADDRDELVAGLALGIVDLLVRQCGGVSGAREVLKLELKLLDSDVSDD